jgi:hypothetical protein
MKHLLKLNEYNDLSLQGDWQEIDSSEYWTNTKSADSFTKPELNLIDNICDKNHLRLVKWGFGASIRMEREASAVDKHTWGSHSKQFGIVGLPNVLWKITVTKVEDEWFYIFTDDVDKSTKGDEIYKADQISGLMSFLDYKIKELNIKYNYR